jgi:hypothetical protein
MDSSQMGPLSGDTISLPTATISTASKPNEFASRVKDQASFATAAAAEKIAIMDRGGYSHALLEANVAVGQVSTWVQIQFPAGSVEVLYADGNSALLARQR